MAEGFKLLDAYVEVTASGKGLADKVSSDFAAEAPAAAKKSASSFGASLVSGFGALPSIGKSMAQQMGVDFGAGTETTSKAAQKLADDVQKATDRVTAAVKREADATGSLKLAQMNLAEVQKKYPADSLQMATATERVASAQRSLQASLQNSERASTSLRSAQKAASDGVADESESMTSRIGGLFKGFAGNILTGIIGGVTAGAVNLIGGTVSDITGMLANIGRTVASTVIDFNSTLQNATIGFTTMLGSGEKSAAFLNQLQDFAKTTPFEFKNLISNAQNMMGMGIAAKDVIPDLTALGDSVASIGGSAAQVDSVTLAFDQMAAKGTLDMGNMNQLMQGGVPSALKILASAYKTTTGNMITMISTGKVQADVALPALVKGIEKGTSSTAALGGMMAKQSTTFTGALSNIQDGLTQTVSKAFKPFFDVASSGMQRFATALSGKPAQKFQTEVTGALKPMASAINGWFKTVDIDDIFTKAGKAITGMLKGINPKEVMGGLQDVMKSAGDIMGDIIKQAPKVAKAFKDMGPGLHDTGKSAVDLVGTISDIISWFVKLEDATDKMRDNFAHNWGEIIDGVKSLAKNFAHNWGEITDGISDVMKWMKNLKTYMGDWGKGAKGWLADAGKNIIDGLVGGIQDRIGKVTDIIGSVAKTVKDTFTSLLGIESPSKVFAQYGKWVGEGLHKGLLGTIDQIKSSSKDLAAAVKSAFTTTDMSSSQEKSALKDISSTTKQLVSDAKARDAAVTALSAAKDKLSGLKSDKASYGADIRSSVLSSVATGSSFANGVSDLNTWNDANTTYASQMADYNKGLAKAQTDYAKGLADAQAKDAQSSTTASGGLLDGKSYQSSYTTQGGGTNVADYIRDNGSDPSAAYAADNAMPVNDAGAKPLTGVARIKADLKKLLVDTKAFTANLKTLMKMGMDKTTLQQLIDAGPTAGLDITTDLISDPAGMKEIVNLQKGLYTATTSLGAWSSGQMYDSKISDATQLVNDDKGAVTYQNITLQVDAESINDVAKMMAALTALSKTAKAAKAKASK
jgi:tape measure domain-containing protein